MREIPGWRKSRGAEKILFRDGLYVHQSVRKWTVPGTEILQKMAWIRLEYRI